ncbi:MAG: response regulator [Candidatus Saccharibacteria bacterium]
MISPLKSSTAFKLKKEGFDVQDAGDGEQGLELIKNFRPDLILLDLLMPIKNGEDMLEELRQFNWAKDIRVIVLTNISKDEAPSKLRLLNVDRYIVKAHYTPIKLWILLEKY